jgi:Flp pilus assembly protein TadG
MHKRTRSLKNRVGEQGGTLVEFAVVFMVFLTFLFGLLDFGRALYVYHFVSYAARDGTRFAIVRGAACTTFPTACPTKLDGSEVRGYLQAGVPPGVDPNALTVTTTWPGNNPGCTGPVNSPGCVVNVKVQYNFSFIIPFVPKLTSLMTSTSQMVISQ